MKPTMKHKVLWWGTNILILILIYFGLYKNVIWCQNLFKFLIWLKCILSILVYISGKEAWEKERQEPFPVSSITHTITSFILVGILASIDWYLYATLYFISFAIQDFIFFKR